MSRLRDLPIRRKLTMIAVTAAGAAIFLACASFVAYELITFRAAMVRNLSTQAEIVARQSAAALVFKDPETASATLDALRAEPRVVSAAIYAQDGSLFASYVRDGGGEEPAASRPPSGPAQGYAFGQGRLALFRPIRFDNGVIGTVLIESDLGEMVARLQRYALIVLCVLLASFVVAHWTASRLQRVITVPVQRLAETAAAVSTRRDYSVRAVADARDELGQLVTTFNHMLDQIRDRDAALHASEEQYRLLFDSNPHPMWVFEPGTLAFLAVNDAAVGLYGYSRDEFLSMTIKDIRPADDVPGLLEHLKEPQAVVSSSDGVWKHRRKDGSTIDVEVSSSATVFRGRPARFVLATDVSERKRLEVQLLQSQKMEAVGRLAGGVAHDFNNLLGVITGYSELMGKNLQPQDPARKRLEQIRKAAERAAGLTRQLLAFSRKEVIRPKVLDLNEVVADIEKMLQRLIGEDVQLVTRLSADLGRVKADRGQIDQVILNLAVNARDAMPKGGDLTIETSNQVLDEAYARSHADVVPGRYVMLAVSDTGHGMDAVTLSHVFEPFFTTKEQGKGTGLGLATVFGIASQSAGHVNVYSEAGKGATFKLYLPRVDAEADAPEGAQSIAPPPRGTETILLVEDAVALGAMIHEILEAAGFSVLEFSDPQEAVFRAEAHQGPLDLVLTDVVMPRMSGPDLVRAVQAIRPHVKALFMSGYTNEAIGRQGVLEPGTHFLQKPFNADALLQSVRTAIDEGRRPEQAAGGHARPPHAPGASESASSLPVAAVRPRMMEPDHRLWSGHTETSVQGAAQTVLIIEDDSTMRSVLAAHVRDLGFACAEAEDGHSGFALARQTRPSLVLLDVRMPLMDGREVLALLKEDPQLREVPVIVISGSDETDLAAACVESGAEDYLSKPVNSTLLRARLRSSLESSRLREQELADRRRMSRYGLELEERVREKTRSLAEAHERLKILDEAKDGFLSLIAHELRTPATGASGATEVLAGGELDEAGRRVATDLLRVSVGRLLRIVEDALLLTTIKTSVEALSLRPHPLAPIWAGARARALSVALSRDVGIASAPAEAGSVLCDEDMLQQALAALLECAAKFSAPGEIVQASLTRTSDSVRIRLQARGHSVPEEAIPRFFDVFSMAKPVTPGGDLGLGPAVAAHVLRMLGGSVVVDNTEDGVCFTVVLQAVGMPPERAD